jgi:hypothetical protein
MDPGSMLTFSMTEGEGWCPLGVQCQVHCTPLMQASAQAAADSPEGCADKGGGGWSRSENEVWLWKGEWVEGRRRSFWISSVYFVYFVMFAYNLGRPIRGLRCNPWKQSFSGVATTFKLSAGLTALPHSSIYLEQATSGKWIHHHHHTVF